MGANSLKKMPEDCRTRDAAQALGLAVRSVQLMVDRGGLQACKTPGGHRRISLDLVERRVAQCSKDGVSARPTPIRVAAQDPSSTGGGTPRGARRTQMLLIKDSAHCQTRLLLDFAALLNKETLHA